MSNLDLTATSRSTRAHFLQHSTLLVGGALSMGVMTACSPGARTVLPGGSGDRTPMKSYTFSSQVSGSIRGAESSGRAPSVFQNSCSDPSTCTGGGGTIDVYSNVNVRATTLDGSQFCEANEASSTSTIVTTSSSAPMLSNVTAYQSTNMASTGVAYTTTYSNNSSVTRTVASDGATVSGTYFDPSGNTWQLTAIFSATSVTITYSGPQSGSITVSTDQVNTSSDLRAPQGCSASDQAGIAKVGAAFDVAALFLASIGIGAPVGVGVAVIGAALATYSAFCR